MGLAVTVIDESGATPCSALRFWNLQIPANLSGEEVVDFAVSRDCGRLASDAIHENRVLCAFAP
jgi:hypothetical protein